MLLYKWIILALLTVCVFTGANAASLKEESTAKGKELYLSYGCAVCHGKNGEGDGINAKKFDPSPTNFHDPQAYTHGNDKGSIAHSIQHGIREENSIMPAFKDISRQELDQIVDFLMSLQKNKQ